MGEITAKGTGIRLFASVAYFLPFITWGFGPLVFYFEFRKKSRFITFHVLYSLYLLTLATNAAVIPLLNIPLLVLVFLLWAYGLVMCAFGRTPRLFRGMITAQVERTCGH